MIDAHVHIWRLNAPEVRWPGPDSPALYRDFGLNDFWALAAPLGVTGAILVQTQTDERDTDRLLSAAEGDDGVLGVVGWVDLLSDDAPTRIARLAARPKLAGLRPMVQDLDADWLDNPALSPVFAAMVDADLRFDALVRLQHLPSVRRLAQRFPSLRIVIDHAAKPNIAGEEGEPWLEALRPLAETAGVYCKLSGLLTEAAPDQPLAAVAPYGDAILDMFGSDRVMWGGDWPVVTLAAEYGAWLRLARGVVSADAATAVFDTTARRFYGV